ncbi:MAG: GTP pyrophosphokinase [Christensenellales bacterium]
MLDRAIELAVIAHRGQFENEPYIFHPLRVMMRMDSETGRIVGVLHDVVERGGISLQKLYGQGFSEEIVGALDALSRRKGEKYFDYILRAASGRLSAAVKLADLKDNIRKARRYPDGQSEEKIKRYKKARKIIRKQRPLGGRL